MTRRWYVDGACRGLDPDLFFPERGESTADAKAVCAGCVVRAECLEWALATRERFGIWGGTSERERRRLRRSAAAASVVGERGVA
ncbi:MAG: WhiB family transcriptional regulator [Actinomycetota bacterium]